MVRRGFWTGLGAAAVLVAAACATGTAIDFGDDGGVAGGDGGGAEASACPQFDLSRDPKHCGQCTRSCNVDQVCSMGACKAECDPPTTKCVGDAGGCFDLTADPKHCGQCATVCSAGDGGGLDPGNGNPDAGIPFDGGYDGGVGWTLGTPSCAKGTCGVGCPGGFTACTDGVCYDTQNHHEHCGDCTTACQSTEWCTQGHCCSTGQMWCNGACQDVLSDDNNCGACGNKCGSNLHCSGGACQSCGGYAALNACWYMSGLGVSCNTTCAGHGGLDAVNGAHTGNPICMHFYPNKANGSNWVTVECCSTDNNTDWGANGQTPDGTFSHSACYLACPCKT